MIPESVIIEILQEVIDKFLIPKFNELGMKASGNWIDTLEIRTDNGRGEIWGSDYTQQLVNGRFPGKMPPIEPIERWVNVKLGLYGSQARSAAFGIANKIAKQGTTWYEKGGSELLEVLDSKEVDDHIKFKIGNYINAAIQIQITRMLNETLLK